jgi:hypothetical protein
MDPTLHDQLAPNARSCRRDINSAAVASTPAGRPSCACSRTGPGEKAAGAPRHSSRPGFQRRQLYLSGRRYSNRMCRLPLILYRFHLRSCIRRVSSKFIGMDAVPVAGNIVDGSVNARASIIVGLGINGGKNIVDGTTAVGIHRLMATHRATEDRYHAPSS